MRGLSETHFLYVKKPEVVCWVAPFRFHQRFDYKVDMISILAQERLLGAALGSVFTGVVIFEQRRDIYKMIAKNQPPKAQMKEPVSRKKIDFAHYWNKSVDHLFGPGIQALSSRRW